MNGTRGIPKGQAPRRLTDNQRQIIITLLKAVPNCAFVTKHYQELVGPVTHMTVCSIKNQLIADGIIERAPLKKETDGAGPAVARAYYRRNREQILEQKRDARIRARA